MTSAPTVTLSPTRTPYEYEELAYTTYCRLHDKTACWGNSHEFLKVKSGGPFDGIDWSRDFWGFGDFWGFNTAFGDLDGDGDLDLVVGDWNGKLYFLDNVGSALRPEFVAAGHMSPFDQIDVGIFAAPALADLDNDDDLDLIVGENKGKLFYFENKGSARWPEFDQTGDTSLFSGGIATGAADLDYMPALADLDGDGP